MSDHPSTPPRDEWPDPAAVASRFRGQLDEEAAAASFVKKACAQAHQLTLEAFIAFQVYRVWEVWGLSEVEAFERHFKRKRRTLYSWKNASGLIDEERSRAIKQGMRLSISRSAVAALPSPEDWTIGDQMGLPFDSGFSTEPLQQAGRELLSAVGQVESMSTPEIRAVAAMCEQLGSLAADCRKALVGRLARVDEVA